MRRVSFIIGLALVLSVLLAAQAMAAPSVMVSAKYTALNWAHCAGVELGFPMSDNWSALIEGGVCLNASASGFAFAGIRYYLTPEGLRPFATLYGGPWFGGGTVYWEVDGTVGLEYLDASGFRIAGEVGAGYEFGTSPYFTGGLAVGWAF